MLASDQRLVVATPWYPSPEGPYDGVFVRESVAALGHPRDRTTIVHVRNVPTDHPGGLVREETDHGTLVRIDLPIDPWTPRVDVAWAQRRALAEADLPELAEADVVHAHVGMPTGWAVSGLLRDDQRLVTTEHATYLHTVLRLPEGRAAYGEMLSRAHRHLAVSEREARALRQVFPEARRRIAVIGNPVDEERFRVRDEPVSTLDRWIYVGNLIERKGVPTLVRSFAQWCEGHATPSTSLTLVGGGVQEAELRSLAAELGVADRVRFHGPAHPDDLPGLFGASDLLVHLSSFETFGLTVVEAAMSGLPVVVTASGGPEETMSDASSQGLVELVGARPRPEEVVAAVERLGTQVHGADRPAVREVLVDRYGTASYRRRLSRALAGQELDDPAGPGRPVVLCLATSTRAAGRLARVQGEALRAGARVALVTSVTGDATAADPRVAVLDLARREAAMPWHLGLDLVVRRGPAVLLRTLRKACSLAASVPGPHRGAARRGVNLVSAVLSKHTVLARRLSAIVDRAVWTHVDPPRVARYAVARHDDWFRAVAPDVVVMGDGSSLPLAWRLARMFPGTEVVGAVSDATVRQLVADRRARGAAAPAGTGSDAEG